MSRDLNLLPANGTEVIIDNGLGRRLALVLGGLRVRPNCGDIFASSTAANTVLRHNVMYREDGSYEIVNGRGFTWHRGRTADLKAFEKREVI